MIDLHTHLLPAVDDGAATLAESMSALHAMRSQGVTQVALTPHLSASETRVPSDLEAHLSRLDASWRELRAMTTSWGPSLARGVELMLDIPDADLSDPRLRLGGTRFVLLEFQAMEVPPRALEVLRSLPEQGVVPVVAHPERYGNFVASPAALSAWTEAGALFQVNHPSLLGVHGRRACTMAWRLLEQGAVSFLASDYHSRGKLRTTEAVTALREAGADEEIELLTMENPRRLLAGEHPLAVPPLRIRTSLWTRLMRAAISERPEPRG